jgi:hypothetical protein
METSSFSQDRTGEQIDSRSHNRLSDGHPRPQSNRSSITLIHNDKPQNGVEQHRSYTAIFVVALYSCLALLSWIILCVLNYRPLTTAHYGVSGDTNYYRKRDATHSQALEPPMPVFAANERWLTAARALQFIVAVVAVPMTVAICARASYIFTQEGVRKGRLSRRQLTVFTEKAWSDPRSWMSMAIIHPRVNNNRNRQSRVTNMFPALVLFLVILSALIYPLQQLFITRDTAKSRTEYSVEDRLFDILELTSDDVYVAPDDNRLAVAALASLTSALSIDPQPRLWARNQNLCPGTTAAVQADYDKVPLTCQPGANRLADIPLLDEPFLAQLPAGYNTGLIKQVAPRISSSVTRTVISADEFPEDCPSTTGAFYSRYEGALGSTRDGLIGPGLWGIEACMPDDQRLSPWSATRSKQQFSETLYLNMTASEDSGYAKIQIDTTAGYFQLPNYFNGQTPGPLIEDDPQNYDCGDSCTDQWFLTE